MTRAAFALAVLLVGLPAFARQPDGKREPQPVRAATLSNVVVTGTVTAVECEPTDAKLTPSAAEEVGFTITVVKIDRPLLGAKNLTHVRIGVPVGREKDGGNVIPKDGKVLLFLRRHPTAGFLVPSRFHPSVELGGPAAADTLCRVEAVTDAVNDPVKALSAEKKDDRVVAAAVLAERYRNLAKGATDTVEVDRPAEESRLLLAALAEADWSARLPDGRDVNGLMHSIQLNPTGFAMERTVDASKDRFVKWLAEDGKTARVRQAVAKE